VKAEVSLPHSELAPIFSHKNPVYDISPFSSPNIIQVIKSRGIKWAGHVARVGARRGTYKVWMEKPKGRRPFERTKRKW
jgi:hypothetical protein